MFLFHVRTSDSGNFDGGARPGRGRAAAAATAVAAAE